MRQASGIIEEVDRQEKLRQMEKEKQLVEEFKKIQKQLSEDLKQQMEHNYQQKIQEIYRRSKMKQTMETHRVLELLQRNLRKEGYEVLAPTEQLLCWRRGEAGHRKKDCLKTLFCTNCGIHSINADNWLEEHAPTAPGQTILKSIVCLDNWII